MSIFNNQRDILPSPLFDLRLMTDEYFFNYLDFTGYKQSDFEAYQVGYIPPQDSENFAQFRPDMTPKAILLNKSLELLTEQKYASLYHEFTHFHDWVLMESNNLVAVSNPNRLELFPEYHAHQVEFCYMVGFRDIKFPTTFSFQKKVQYYRYIMPLKDFFGIAAKNISTFHDSPKDFIYDIATYVGYASVLKRYCIDAPKECFVCPKVIADIHPQMSNIWETLISSFHPFDLNFIKRMCEFEKEVRKI